MTLGSQHEKPVYVRLRETIADAILAGRYTDGDSLPSVRAFAAEQSANPLTVAKAYQGFQDEGLITTRRGIVQVVDRAGLKRRACECYSLLDDHFSAVIGASGSGAEN